MGVGNGVLCGRLCWSKGLSLHWLAWSWGKGSGGRALTGGMSSFEALGAKMGVLAGGPTTIPLPVVLKAHFWLAASVVPGPKKLLFGTKGRLAHMLVI